MGILCFVGGGIWFHKPYEHKGKKGRLYYMCNALTEKECKDVEARGFKVLHGHFVTSHYKRAMDMVFIEGEK